MNWITRRGFSGVTAMISCVLSLGCAAARPVEAQSLPETVEAIHKARVSTRILFITAHPDDEWSSLLAYLSHGLNADVALLTITRGQGGQNAIGPEQDGELGVVRTEELLAAGQHYGVQQYFTRALDTGYLKSPDQALKVWGNLALEDMVRVIRTYRPDVVINGWGGVHSGHGHHQESGILTPQAVTAAADPKMFPEQIAEGLTPWKVTLEARVSRGGTAENAVALPADEVSPLWGKTYVEIGMEGHAQHRSQGTPAFFGNAFFRRPVFLVAENEKGEGGKFDPQLLAEPLASLAARFPAAQAVMVPALNAADQELAAAAKSAQELDRAAAAKSLVAAAKEIAGLREQLAKQGGDGAAAVWEIDGVLKRINLALADDVAIPLNAQASRHELVAGETFSVDVSIAGTPAAPVKWTLDASSIVVPSGWSVTPEGTKGATRRQRGEIHCGDSGGGETIADSSGCDSAISAAAGAIGAARGSCRIRICDRTAGEFDGGHYYRDTDLSFGAGAGGDVDRGAETGDGAGETGGDADETFRAGALSRHGGDESDGGTGRAEGLDGADTEPGGAAGVCEGWRPVDSVCGDGAGGN